MSLYELHSYALLYEYYLNKKMFGGTNNMKGLGHFLFPMVNILYVVKRPNGSKKPLDFS